VLHNKNSLLKLKKKRIFIVESLYKILFLDF
jgi:hypothetical protein